MGEIMTDKTRRLRGIVLAFLTLSALFWARGTPSFAGGQQESTAPYVLPRIQGKVILDGLSNEPAWAGIKPLPVIVYTPNSGAEPSERTEILVAYDGDFIYVAGRLYDREPDKIQATSKKRDDMKLSNDWIGIILDTFHDRENALGFFTTPSGLRLDMAIFKDGEGDFPVNESWNTFWDVKTVRNQEGWFAEMRIPLSSLRFQVADGRVVMGMTVWRYIARKSEVIIFPAIPAKWGFWGSFKPSQTRDIVLDGMTSHKPLYVAPYVLGGYGRSYDLNGEGTAYDAKDKFVHEAGLDVKYGLTNNLTLDLTVNTDFAQVEADDEQINLTRFSLFFPEKRLFFQERASVFDFNFGNETGLFYSRRIGIHEGELVRIYGGARLIGRVGDWDLGFLDMQTAAIEDVPSQNLGVLRVRRQVFNPNSWVGAIATSQVGLDGTFNTAYGLDGIVKLFGDDYMSWNWAQTFATGETNRAFSLDSAKFRINWQRRTLEGLAYDLDFSRAGADYDPGLGFEFRDDYSRFGNRVLYGWLPGEGSWLLRHSVFVNGYLYLRNADGETESYEIGPGYQFTSKSSYYAMVNPKFCYENVPESFSLSDEAEIPAGRYRFFDLNFTFNTPSTSPYYLEGMLDVGSFYDGRRFSVGISPRWDVSSGLEIGGFYEFDRVTFPDRDQKFVAHIGRLRILAMLSTKFSAAAFVQYSSADNEVTANVRIRYNPREGTDFYIVYNDGLNTDRLNEIPILPRSMGRTLLVKYTYTFNFR
jgi:Domain of unknown function (DUF5916)